MQSRVPTLCLLIGGLPDVLVWIFRTLRGIADCRRFRESRSARRRYYGRRRHVSDLVLLDWMLPGPPGVNFARQLRADQRTKDIPIIMLTARAQLLDGVWGDHVFVEERTVDVHIHRLRQALEPTEHDSLVETVRGTGYRFRRTLG